MLSDPVGKTPQPAALAGFVPRRGEDGVAQHLLRPYFSQDRERFLLASFDAFDRLAALESAEGDATGRCMIPPRCWRNLLGGGIVRVLMAHNHPSGTAQPSDADLRCTQEAALFLRTAGIELTDHLIFVDTGHFSFRDAQLL